MACHGGLAVTERLRVCVAGSGGGHIRQLLDLESVWSQHDYFFVTEDTALGRTLERDHPTRFVPHVAWGQAKMGAPLKMLAAGARNFVRSAAIIFRERPQVVISSGAGAVFFTVLWARLLGACVVVIESFARFDNPSLFGRLAAPLAHHTIIQSAKLKPYYPKARVFDPFTILASPPPPKQELLFATVGATLPFERLVASIVELKREGAIPERVIIQTNGQEASVEGIETVASLPFDQVHEILQAASIVVCHGGTGSLITALRAGCNVIAMPRLATLGEHYDDHQAEITAAFAERGLVQVANSVAELRSALIAARSRVPVLATTNPEALRAFLNDLLRQPLADQKRKANGARRREHAARAAEVVPPAKRDGVRICFAGSGGGHLRQLLDLESIWSKHDHFFVTEDLALGHSLDAEHRTYFVPHFAWGQVKLGSPLRMLGTAIVSVWKSAVIIFRERPDIVISEGAGAVYFAVLWARLFGACVVIIESFARFDGPSLFGRLASPLAHHLVAQSATLSGHYPKAMIFDPLRILDAPAPPKKDLLFVTVGATLPFDRLIDTVARLKAAGAITERVIMQTGVGGMQPEGLDAVESLPFAEVQAILQDASIVVCHGGTGSLITALRQGCQVIAMPRREELGEHYDDHQTEITAAFAKRGLIFVANSAEELTSALEEARRRKPVVATSDPTQLTDFLSELIAQPGASRKHRRWMASSGAMSTG